jgi:hypothetical protein
MSGTELIAAERKRQVDEELFDAHHDHSQPEGTLTMAAICYASIAAADPGMRVEFRSASGGPFWPWDKHWYKPGRDDSNASRILELTKAGALIAAEIDRLEALPEATRVQ